MICRLSKKNKVRMPRINYLRRKVLETDNIKKIFISFLGGYRKSSNIYNENCFASYTFPGINKVIHGDFLEVILLLYVRNIVSF